MSKGSAEVPETSGLGVPTVGGKVWHFGADGSAVACRADRRAPLDIGRAKPLAEVTEDQQCRHTACALNFSLFRSRGHRSKAAVSRTWVLPQEADCPVRDAEGRRWARTGQSDAPWRSGRTCVSWLVLLALGPLTEETR